MRFIRATKHFISVHKKETIYFCLIYMFAMIPGMIGFVIVNKVRPSETLLMLFFLVVPTLPASIYTEYSYRKLGYKNPILAALNIFLFLNFLLILLLNLESKFLPFSTNIILAVLGALILGCEYYFVENDSCSCKKPY